MEGFLVSAATGALTPVLKKLAAVLGKKYKLFKKVRNEVKSLRAELEAMHAFLLKMSEEENPNPQDRLWTKAVRELSYDIEDSLDKFMDRVDNKSAKPKGFIAKCKDLVTFTKTKARYEVAKAIEDLKTQANDVAGRNARYKIREVILKTSNATVDKRALAAFQDASELIGIDGPKDELIKLLKIEDGQPKDELIKLLKLEDGPLKDELIKLLKIEDGQPKDVLIKLLKMEDGRPKDELIKLLKMEDGRPKDELIKLLKMEDGRPKDELIKLLKMEDGRPKDELIKLLKIEDGRPKDMLIKLLKSERLNVVSILGPGGMGKTTLAGTVYEVLRDEFECSAIVSVSRKPDMMNILRNILAQVSKQPYHSTEAADVPQLVGNINCHLKDKRYLIVVDDIWKEDAWEIINHALFKNSKHSRVITTTRSYDVARTCQASHAGCVYKIRSLSAENSERLFFKRIFDSKSKCPSQLIEVSRKILGKCDGLPLAIISIAGLLANKPQTKDEWNRVQKSIGRALENDRQVESMRQILSLSYLDLPLRLQTCLLYLSFFPEDFSISKKRLIRRWIAEGLIHEEQQGFIHEEQRYTLYELGEMCFSELINRSLIQPWYIDMYGEVMACRVHDIILDFITSKSVEENFVTVSGDGYLLLSPGDKVRRLSIRSASPENISTLTGQNLSHVRSLAMFNNYVELPSLWDFSCLRVVDLEGCQRLEGHHLADIGDLFLLRYLSVRGTGVTELPESIFRLRRLLHLVVGKDLKLPDGTGSMGALQVLDCVNLFMQSIEFTQDISKLTDLRDVSFYLSKADSMKCGTGGSHCKKYIDTMVSSVCKLVYLHSLSIDIDQECTEDFSLDLGDCPSRVLRKFIVGDVFISRVPNWIGSLINLQFLTLRVKEFEVENILVLGSLPALVFLGLVAEESFPGRRVTISGDHGFECLRHFDFGCAIPVMFGVGAMPKLEKLTLLFSAARIQQEAGDGDFPFGIRHLSSLNSIECLIHYGLLAVIKVWKAEMNPRIAEMSCRAVKAAVAKMRNTVRIYKQVIEVAVEIEVRANPRLPKLEFLRTDIWSMKHPLGGLISGILSKIKKIMKVMKMLPSIEEEWITRCRHHLDGPKDHCSCKHQDSS